MGDRREESASGYRMISTAVGLAGGGLILLLAATVEALGIAAAISVLVVLVGLYAASKLPRDTTSVVIVALFVLLLVPARLRIEPLRSLGTPGALVGTAAFVIWAFGKAMRRGWLARGSQPLRWAFAVGGASVLASYISMGYRPHTVLEAKAADRGIVTFLSMAGVALLAADGIDSRERLRAVLKVIAGLGAAVAGLGVVQFMTGQDFAARVHIPGFSQYASEYDASRSGFSRIVSTTSHPIELSVVLVMVFAVALHLVLTEQGPYRWVWICVTGLIGMAIPMTVSRTAVIAFAVLLIVLFPSWTPDLRRRMSVILLLSILAMRVMIPGLIGTLRSLLFHSGNDPSVTSRTAGFQFTLKLISVRPAFGRGFGTFLPPQYPFLDDQMLLSVVETGVVGVLAVVGIFATGAWATRVVRRVSPLNIDADLAQTLLGCLAAGLASSFTFDSFSFPTGRTLLMLLVGLSGALWRITSTERSAKYNSSGVEPTSASADHRPELAGAT